jgi:hypothetical protein
MDLNLALRSVADRIDHEGRVQLSESPKTLTRLAGTPARLVGRASSFPAVFHGLVSFRDLAGFRGLRCRNPLAWHRASGGWASEVLGFSEGFPQAEVRWIAAILAACFADRKGWGRGPHVLVVA